MVMGHRVRYTRDVEDKVSIVCRSALDAGVRRVLFQSFNVVLPFKNEWDEPF
jgi:hypothetical protein